MPRAIETIPSRHFTECPCADKGLTSYRYRGRYGWIMIGATGNADALKEAQRSTHEPMATLDKLQVWNGSEYKPAV